MESEITGSGTCIELIETSTLPSVKVSPEAQSMPNSATMSPAPELVDLLHVVGVHAHQPPDLVLLGAAVDDLVALRDRALVDAQVGELAVAPVLELEGERHQRLVRVALDLDRRPRRSTGRRRVLDVGRGGR